MKTTVLITGASRGIGAAAARVFAREGYRVAINYCQSRQEAERLCEELCKDAAAMTVRADVGDVAEVEAMFCAVENRFGPIDVLVNNAGIAQPGLLQDVTDEEWRRMFAVNVDGAFYCCRRALPAMIRSGRGSIVNLSSVWGMTGASCEAAYSASKAAVIGLTKALAKEVGPSGIRVNCVAPGVVDTDMNAALDDQTRSDLQGETPLGRLGTPDDIAEAILFLASGRARFITGQVLSPNGGFVI